ESLSAELDCDPGRSPPAESRSKNACGIGTQRVFSRGSFGSSSSQPNDCRINCDAASHGDEERGTLPASDREWTCGRRAARERGLLEPASRPAGQRAPRWQLLAAVSPTPATELAPIAFAGQP